MGLIVLERELPDQELTASVPPATVIFIIRPSLLSWPVVVVEDREKTSGRRDGRGGKRNRAIVSIETIRGTDPLGWPPVSFGKKFRVLSDVSCPSSLEPTGVTSSSPPVLSLSLSLFLPALLFVPIPVPFLLRSPGQRESPIVPFLRGPQLNRPWLSRGCHRHVSQSEQHREQRLVSIVAFSALSFLPFVTNNTDLRTLRDRGSE